VLRFSPTAWAKLLFLRDAGESEIGGFGIAAASDLLFVEDVQLVRQTSTWITAEFDDESVADFFDAQVDEGRQPEEFFRLFMHTHPGNSAQPSLTDEETFARVFGRTDWAVMFILARGGQCYARLRYNVGPGADVELPVEVDYGREFDGSDFMLWHEEYLVNVCVPPPEPAKITTKDEHSKLPLKALAPVSQDDQFIDDWWRDAWTDYSDFDRYPEEVPYGYIRDF
jgi:proteasome lid subunit RPN8/RPN11